MKLQKLQWTVSIAITMIEMRVWTISGHIGIVKRLGFSREKMIAGLVARQNNPAAQLFCTDNDLVE